MRRALAVAFSFAVLAGTAQAQARAAAIPGARQADEAIARGLKGNDLEAIMAAYADEAVFFPPGEMAQTGKAAIRKGFSEFLGAFRILDFVVSDVRYAGAGDLSVAFGRFTLSAAPKGGGEFVRWEGRYTLVARRVGGKWLVVSDHASLPAGAPPSMPQPVSAPRR